MAKKTVDDIQVKGKRVLVRCDFNVPMKDGKITNDKRIVAALPTIQKLIKDGGKVILCSHLGKPKNGPEEKFSLAPVAVRLSELLGQKVVFANDDNVVGENAKAAVAAMQDGDVVLLQNTRFRKEETIRRMKTFISEALVASRARKEQLRRVEISVLTAVKVQQSLSQHTTFLLSNQLNHLSTTSSNLVLYMAGEKVELFISKNDGKVTVFGYKNIDTKVFAVEMTMRDI